MNSTVAIQQLAKNVATQSGYTPDYCEKFITEMFRTVEEGLKESSQVRIKDFGEFAVADGEIRFTPDKNLAEAVNEPFAFFEPEELDDDFDYSKLNEPQGIDENASTVPTEEKNPEGAEIPEIPDSPEESEKVENTEDTADSEASETAEDSETAESAEPAEQVVDIKSTEVQENDSDEIFVTPQATGRPAAGWIIFLAGLMVGIAVGTSATFFCLHNDFYKNEEQVEIINNTVEPSSECTALPSPEPMSPEISEPENPVTEDTSTKVVTDTVRTTLAAISRRHYGTYEFWVYIYEENRQILSNPDLVEPGTVVVIPSPEKYGIDRNDSQSVKKALSLSSEIYARFKK